LGLVLLDYKHSIDLIRYRFSTADQELFMNRRQTLSSFGHAAVALGTSFANIHQAQAQPLSSLDIFIPADAGGGWDTLGRELGTALQSSQLISNPIFENKGGKGGTIGLEAFVKKHNANPNALLVGGMIMVGAIAVNRPAVDLKQVSPLARLTGDYVAIAVANNSPLSNMQALLNKFKANPNEFAFVGGSAGGIDHLMAGWLTREQGVQLEQLKYLPLSSGKDALQTLLDGKAQALIGGYSELKQQAASGVIRMLGISSSRSFAGVPSLRESGVRVELINWRGVFAPAGIDAAARARLEKMVSSASRSPAWQESLKKHSWQPIPMYGRDFELFIQTEQAVVEVLVGIMKLRKSS
jgi:putative tricarboxylic transport membrane protein